jgi:hypothetical protein
VGVGALSLPEALINCLLHGAGVQVRSRGKIYRTLEGAGGHKWSNEKNKKSVPRKVKSRSSGRKAVPRKAKRGYEMHTGKPTGREVQAMHRLQILTERYIAEGLTPADARTAPERNCELIHVRIGAR